MTFIAFDVGAKRIGVAISRSGIIAEPLTTIQVDATIDAQLRSIIDRESPSVIVVGQPEREGSKSALVELFIDKLKKIVLSCVKIDTTDETLTTKEAERLSRPGDDTDALAATLILEQYLAGI